ncbi:ATP-binding protein [Chlorogloeopsis sp. ULAP02]|uniref:ATP-binding protein n=1 Tax=Chlorogloeopsis sp. ULAP02 TaxID=3107926 RepID=UPI00313552F8
MSCSSGDWQREKRTLEVLSSLSYRTGEINRYLQEITLGVSELLELDWSVVTLCQDGFERVLASSIDLGNGGNQVYSLHGLVTGTVVNTRQSLVVEDTKTCTDYGKAPSGYRAYLGVPLRTAQGEVIGTICSFHKTPRHFTAEEVKIAELFAERAATAIDNYHLYQQQLQFNHILEDEVARRTEQLRAAQTKLVEQERLAAIGEFAACIIHEIRNPFTTMKMGLNFFQRLELSEPAKERLYLTLDEANWLERLLKEILLYAKPQKLQLEKIDINQFIDEILPTLREMPEAVLRQIEFSAAINVAQVLGDKDKLKQVLINIMRNACEAIPEGERVKLIIYSDVNNNQVYINIHNSGVPISPEDLLNLTKPFYSTKSSGTGLGLAITKRIVEAHNGKLLIESIATKGTTVSVQLPLTTNC